MTSLIVILVSCVFATAHSDNKTKIRRMYREEKQLCQSQASREVFALKCMEGTYTTSGTSM